MMSDFTPEAKRISNESAVSWQKLAQKAASLNRIVNVIDTLAERGYILQVSKLSDDYDGYTVELYVRYNSTISHSGFVGVGDSLESALDDLVSDERLKLGEAE